MNIQATWKLLFASTIIAIMMVGCASSPPSKMVKQNDHASLAAWYQNEARDLHARAEEMHQMGKEYEIRTPKQGQQSSLVEHCKNLEDKYLKAAEAQKRWRKPMLSRQKNRKDVNGNFLGFQGEAGSLDCACSILIL